MTAPAAEAPSDVTEQIPLPADSSYDVVLNGATSDAVPQTPDAGPGAGPGSEGGVYPALPPDGERITRDMVIDGDKTSYDRWDAQERQDRDYAMFDSPAAAAKAEEQQRRREQEDPELARIAALPLDQRERARDNHQLDQLKEEHDKLITGQYEREARNQQRAAETGIPHNKYAAQTGETEEDRQFRVTRENYEDRTIASLQNTLFGQRELHDPYAEAAAGLAESDTQAVPEARRTVQLTERVDDPATEVIAEQGETESTATPIDEPEPEAESRSEIVTEPEVPLDPNKAAEDARKTLYAEGRKTTVQDLMKADDIHKLQPKPEAPIQGPETFEQAMARAQENPDDITKEELQDLLAAAANRLNGNPDADEATTTEIKAQPDTKEEKEDTPAETGDKVVKELEGEVADLEPEDVAPPGPGRATRIWNRAMAVGNALVHPLKAASLEVAGQQLDPGRSLLIRAHSRFTFARDTAAMNNDHNYTHATHSRLAHNALYDKLLNPGVREHLEQHDSRYQSYKSNELPSNEKVRENLLKAVKREVVGAIALSTILPAAGVSEAVRAVTSPKSESLFKNGIPGARELHDALSRPAADTPGRKRLEQVQIDNEVQARMEPYADHFDRQEELQRARRESEPDMPEPGAQRRLTAEQIRQQVVEAR